MKIINNSQVSLYYEELIDNKTYFKEEYEIASSLNNKSTCQTIYPDIKYVIVGTITPPHEGKGEFYYCTNPFLYVVLDKSIIAKHDNYGECRVHKDWEEIKNNLKEDKIGFIDVFDQVIRLKKSHADNDIIAGTLDTKNIKRVWNNNKNTIFICTSNLARKLFTECVENIEDYDKRKDSIRQMRLFRTSLANAIESIEEAIK